MNVVISLQYRYFLEDKFFTDTIHISVIETQLRFDGDVISSCKFDKNNISVI